MTFINSKPVIVNVDGEQKAARRRSAIEGEKTTGDADCREHRRSGGCPGAGASQRLADHAGGYLHPRLSRVLAAAVGLNPK